MSDQGQTTSALYLWRWSNTKRGGIAGRCNNDLCRQRQQNMRGNRSRTEDRLCNRGRVRHRTNGTLMARQLRAVIVNVICLDKPCERDQQKTQARQCPYVNVSTRYGRCGKQIRPCSKIGMHSLLQLRAMQHVYCEVALALVTSQTVPAGVSSERG